MSTSKLIIGIVVVLVLIGGFWLWSEQRATPAPSAANVTPTTGGNTAAQQTNTTGGIIASPNDASDASLNADLSAIDNQLNGLSADNAAADQSLSTQ